MSEEPQHQETGSESEPDKKRGSITRLIAFLLDDAIRIPFTKRRIGFDVLLGLIPGYGDATTTAMGSTILLQAARSGVPRNILVRMGFNQLLNGAVGAIPGVGDAFSAYYKSNARNYKLLRDHEGTTDGSWMDKAIVGLIIGALLLVTIGAAIVGWMLIKHVLGPIGETLTRLAESMGG